MLIAVHPLLFKFLVKGKVNLHRPVTAKFQFLLPPPLGRDASRVMLGLVGKILNRGTHGTLHQATKKTGTHARANAIALRSQRQLHETAKRRSPEPLETTPRGVSSSTCFLIHTSICKPGRQSSVGI